MHSSNQVIKTFARRLRVASDVYETCHSIRGTRTAACQKMPETNQRFRGVSP
jgi:hypothetical protein